MLTNTLLFYLNKPAMVEVQYVWLHECWIHHKMLSLHHKHFDSHCYQQNQVIVLVWLDCSCWAFLVRGHEHLTYSFLRLAFVFYFVDLTDAASYTSLIFFEQLL